jgi:signal transduction histidine kinase
MRERAELLGGAISFENPNGPGTLVRLRVPKENVTRETQESHA